MSSFDQALEDRLLLKDLLKNDDNERQFRVALRNKEEKLLGYLSHSAVLEDMVKALVDEEDRSLQEASEVLGILLANLDEMAFVEQHLPLFFSYLDRETMNPRRLYYFLRVASFLFQNKTPELFAFVQKDNEFTSKLVKHLSSVHIMQLVLNMLKLEEQIKELGVPNCDWSVKTNLIGQVVKALQSSPATNLESVNKFMSEICNSYNMNSYFMRSILLAEDGGLIRTLVALTKVKSVSAEAIKLLDEVVFKIIMANKEDEEFFSKVSEHFKQEREVFSQMLKSDSLGEVLVGVKFMHALIKHRALFLLGDGLIEAIGLFFRFPWSNILHNVITGMISHVFQYEEEELIDQLLKAGLLKTIIEGLIVDKPVGYLPHLRMIASAMAESPSITVQEYLGNEPLWEKYVEAMEFRNDKDLSFKEAERRVVAFLREVMGYTPLSSETSEATEGVEVAAEATTEGDIEAPRATEEAESKNEVKEAFPSEEQAKNEVDMVIELKTESEEQLTEAEATETQSHAEKVEEEAAPHEQQTSEHTSEQPTEPETEVKTEEAATVTEEKSPEQEEPKSEQNQEVNQTEQDKPEGDDKAGEQ